MAITYEFVIRVYGTGNNIDEAYQDAVNALYDDPGTPPDEHEIVEREEDETEGTDISSFDSWKD